MQHMQGMPTEPGTQHDWRVISRLLPYLWQFRGRVAIAMALLVAAKTANVLVPVTLKYIVDALDTSLQQPLQMLVVPLGLVFAYGALRFSSVFFGELRDAVFARVAERSLSAISLTVFRHLHQLDLGFHLDRRTGGISRDMERGTNGISFLLRSVVFSVVPILIEVVLVAVIMAVTTDWLFAMIALAGVAGYVVFSVWMTNRRTGLIRTANQRDSDANHRAGYDVHEFLRIIGQWDAAFNRLLHKRDREWNSSRQGQGICIIQQLNWMPTQGPIYFPFLKILLCSVNHFGILLISNRYFHTVSAEILCQRKSLPRRPHNNQVFSFPILHHYTNDKATPTKLATRPINQNL